MHEAEWYYSIFSNIIKVYDPSQSMVVYRGKNIQLHFPRALIVSETKVGAGASCILSVSRCFCRCHPLPTFAWCSTSVHKPSDKMNPNQYGTKTIVEVDVTMSSLRSSPQYQYENNVYKYDIPNKTGNTGLFVFGNKRYRMSLNF